MGPLGGWQIHTALTPLLALLIPAFGSQFVDQALIIRQAVIQRGFEFAHLCRLTLSRFEDGLHPILHERELRVEHPQE